MELLAISGIVLTALLFSVMVAKRKKLFADKFLILYLLVALLSQLLVYFQTTDNFQHSYWMLLAKGIYLLDPVLFFLYVYSLVKQKLPSRFHLLLLFLPFICYCINFLYYYLFIFDKSIISIERGLLFINHNISIAWLIFVSLFMFIQPVVLGCFYYILREYKAAVRQSISYAEMVHVDWLNVLFYIWLIIAMVLLPISVFALLSDLLPINIMELLIEGLTVLFYFIVASLGSDKRLYLPISNSAKSLKK